MKGNWCSRLSDILSRQDFQWTGNEVQINSSRYLRRRNEIYTLFHFHFPLVARLDSTLIAYSTESLVNYYSQEIFTLLEW